MTYFVVAQMGLFSPFGAKLEFDYMLRTINLLFIIYLYLYKINIGRKKNYLNDLKNSNLIQSAGNSTGSLETKRQISNFKKEEDRNSFNSWLAGIVDGKGSFNLIKRKITNKWELNDIKIKVHSRDVKILIRIRDYYGFGTLINIQNKPYSIYIVSDPKEMSVLVNDINGLIRIKVDYFQKSCTYLGIKYIESDYTLSPNDPYFSGLIDTKGFIVFNYSCNRIECNLELNYNKYTKKLNLDNVIPNYKPYILLRKNKKKTIVFKYQTIEGMTNIYHYFMVNRLYSDQKNYRVNKIMEFISIRDLRSSPLDSPKFEIYSNFLWNWVRFKNPLWYKTKFLDYIKPVWIST